MVTHLWEYHDRGWYAPFLPQHLSILFSTGSTAFWSLYGRYHGDNRIGILSKEHFGRLPVCFPNPGRSGPPQYGHSNHEENEWSQRLLRCGEVTSFQNAYFEHNEGNSWHSDSSWFINQCFGCQPVNSLFLVAILLWIGFCGIYRTKYKRRQSLRRWLAERSLFLGCSVVLILILYFWRFVICCH